MCVLIFDDDVMGWESGAWDMIPDGGLDRI